MDITDTLQEGMVAPAGVTASEPKTGKDFSRTPTPPPNGSEPTSQTAAHHHAPTR